MPLSFLRVFRNWIAHHEQILLRYPKMDSDNFLEITSWTALHRRGWTEAHFRVPEVHSAERDSVDVTF